MLVKNGKRKKEKKKRNTQKKLVDVDSLVQNNKSLGYQNKVINHHFIVTPLTN